MKLLEPTYMLVNIWLSYMLFNKFVLFCVSIWNKSFPKVSIYVFMNIHRNESSERFPVGRKVSVTLNLI